jgi:hypothetical protein
MATIYLSNKDLLREIHRSKTSYCSFSQIEHADYDIILPSVSKINIRTLSAARKARADRLTAILREKDKKATPVNPKTITNQDVVIRIMTFEHIPLAPGRKKSPKMNADHYAKLNFPPFQHYKISPEGEPYCVGKSHWKGTVDKGHFCVDKGRISDTLARMFMKLCERYSMRSNWRGYTYVDEMRSQALLQLTMIGLQFDESKSSNPFAYYTAAITNSFTRVLNIEKKMQNIRDDILIENNMTPSFTRQMANSKIPTGGTESNE